MAPHKSILDDICSDSCHNNGDYCTLKEVVLHSGLNDRTLEQLKLVEMYKYEQSKLEEKDIGWNTAFKKWVEKGYAKKFNEVYRDGLTHEVLYDLVMNQ